MVFFPTWQFFERFAYKYNFQATKVDIALQFSCYSANG